MRCQAAAGLAVSRRGESAEERFLPKFGFPPSIVNVDVNVQCEYAKKSRLFLSGKEAGAAIETFKIDEVSKECGLTKRTIRYYEELGLLPPPERSKGGMRLYTRAHIERLRQMADARDALGITLQEMQEFVAIREGMLRHRQQYLEQGENHERKRQELLEVKRFVDKQLEMVDHKLEKLTEFRQEIERINRRVAAALDNLTL
ncbi:MAG: MerR family transcriptional regulator [Paenibacillaceae bacterium]|nr:MerR family transcriptional regulator [Paenibacillaceae bacterium]